MSTPSPPISENEVKNMFSSKGIKYPCRQCGQEFLNKGCLAKHLTSVHDRVKFPCRQCGKQFSRRGYLAKHQRAVHEGAKYPCRDCGKQFSFKIGVSIHQRAVHKVVQYPCGQCRQQFSLREMLLNTKGQNIKKSNTLASNVTIKQLKKDIWLNTKGQ